MIPNGFAIFYCRNITRVKRSCFVYAHPGTVLLTLCRALLLLCNSTEEFAERSDIGCEGVAFSSPLAEVLESQSGGTGMDGEFIIRTIRRSVKFASQIMRRRAPWCVGDRLFRERFFKFANNKW